MDFYRAFALFSQYTRNKFSLITAYSKSIHDVQKKSRGSEEFHPVFEPKNDV